MNDFDQARTRRFARAVARLPQQQRDIFLATGRDGQAIVEIARRMHMTTAQVERLLADAIIGLHRDLAIDPHSIRTGSIRKRWTRLRRRLSARLRHGRSRS
jgi:DNA-directed RNA polymerase specialized sigma24 family protein